LKHPAPQPKKNVKFPNEFMIGFSETISHIYCMYSFESIMNHKKKFFFSSSTPEFILYLQMLVNTHAHKHKRHVRNYESMKKKFSLFSHRTRISQH
jgi:hypothetical protein